MVACGWAFIGFVQCLCRLLRLLAGFRQFSCILADGSCINVL